MIKVIIFDFDGVLVDSNRLKQDAWFVVFDQTVGISPELVSDVLARIPETRYDILREIFRVAGKPADTIETLVAEYAARYDSVVQQGIASGGVFPEARVILPALAQTYRLYVNSATPEDALIRTVERIGLASLFTGIYGRPASKIENMARIFEKEGITGSEAVFIGDAESDYNVAVEVQCRFIGMPNEYNGWTEDVSFPLLHSFSNIEQMINKLA